MRAIIDPGSAIRIDFPGEEASIDGTFPEFASAWGRTEKEYWICTDVDAAMLTMAIPATIRLVQKIDPTVGNDTEIIIGTHTKYRNKGSMRTVFEGMMKLFDDNFIVDTMDIEKSGIKKIYC